MVPPHHDPTEFPIREQICEHYTTDRSVCLREPVEIIEGRRRRSVAVCATHLKQRRNRDDD